MRKKIFVTITVLAALLTLSVLPPIITHDPGPQLAEAKLLTLTPTVTPSDVTPTPELRPEATAAYYPGNLKIWVDRGEGAIYRVCEPIQICYSVPYPVYIRIWDITSAGSKIILQGDDDGTGGCFWSIIEKPLGIERLRIEIGETACCPPAEAETWFYVCDAGPLSAWIWTDQGEGSTYRIGDSMRLCYDVSRPAYVEIWKTTSEGSTLMLYGYDDGRGDCFYRTVGPPAGVHRYRIDGYDCPPGYRLAWDETWVNVFDPEANRIIVPRDGVCRVKWINAISNDCSGDFGLDSPQHTLLFSDYKHRPSPDYRDIGPYNQGTELVFYIRPGGWCGGEYLSTSQNARVTQPDSSTYRIEWEDMSPGQGDDWNDLIVDVQCGIATCPSDQWRGEYYDNRDLQGTPRVRCDSKIDFYWGLGAPMSGILEDNFSVRWERVIDFPTTGVYRFRTFTDDGLRLYVDGECIIDDWTPRTFQERSATKRLEQGSHVVRMEYVEWARAAIAHLTWYLCPGGETDCSMNITPMYQTHYPDVPMPTICPNWRNLPDEQYEQSFYNDGCWVTSFAMALQKHSVNATPTELNEWLSTPDNSGKPRGYRGQCDGNLDPSWIPAFAFDWGRRHGRTIILKLAAVTSRNQAYDLIRDGTPVLMNLIKKDDKGKIVFQHYFLAVDVAEKGNTLTFGINDPWHSGGCEQIEIGGNWEEYCDSGQSQPTNHATTLLDRPYYGSYSSAKYLEEAPAFLASLGFSVAGAEVLVTDAQGRRTGFEPATRQILREIPDWMYFDSKIIPPGGQDDGKIQRTLLIADNAGGNYQLLVSSGVASSFEIDILGFDSQFVPVRAAIAGTAGPEVPVQYQIDFEPGQDIIVRPYTVYLPLILKNR